MHSKMFQNLKECAQRVVGSIFKQDVLSPLVLDDAGYLDFFTKVVECLEVGPTSSRYWMQLLCDTQSSLLSQFVVPGKGLGGKGVRSRGRPTEAAFLGVESLLRWDEYLVTGTDGVGMKLKLALQTGESVNERSVSDPLRQVAMSVNDIVTSGAKPLFFLDYYATSKLNVDLPEKVIKGIVDGCQQSDCILLGGEFRDSLDDAVLQFNNQ
ncbi:Phosphoribosylformylglycinamidine cyclo-ligase, chloroplastic [Hordeum vulgare]|nr:Phosphoribosylformylglycinamidine cyclo-ligase, chloroplastic [Hordeum vulgare]